MLGRPAKPIDSEDLSRLLARHSVRVVAVKLGVHRNTIYNHLKKPRRVIKKVQTEDPRPTFDEYVAARKVVLFVTDELRRQKFKGQLNIASDAMIAMIVHRSCEYFRHAAKP